MKSENADEARANEREKFRSVEGNDVKYVMFLKLKDAKT